MVAGLLVSGCSSSMTEIEKAATSPSAGTSTTSAGSAATKAPDCGDPQQSFNALGSVPGPGSLPPGSYEGQIRQRGRLIVGVSADTMLVGFRNPIDGQIEGFDIDMVRAVAKAILGDPSKVEFRVITAAQRVPVLLKPVDQGGVDLVARVMTMNCDRWSQVSFSSTYLMAHQKVLVPLASQAAGIGDLNGVKVCAPKGTTSLDALKKFPKVTPLGVDTHTDCLALFEQGQVGAITGDDTILAGFAAQDPYAKVVGPSLADNPCGLAMPKGHPEFVSFVNAVLDQMRADGEWQRSYDTWLKAALGAGSGPPKALYGRQP